MPTQRDYSRLRPAVARRAVLRHSGRMERVRAVVAFMDERVGRGWPREMERAGVMLDDIHKSWLVDRKRPTERPLRRLEDYAARFGFVPPARGVGAVRHDVAESLSQWNQIPN